MANLVKNVAVGRPLATGGVWSGLLGAVLPTDSSTALDPSFVGVGYISEDGLSKTVDRSTSKIKAWGGDVVRVTQEEFAVTYEYSMIEALSETANKEVYGEANVAVTAATVTSGTQLVVKINSSTLPHKGRVFEIKDGPARIRIVAPDSQIVEVGDISYADGDVIAYPATVEAFPDAAGNQAYEYIDDGVFAP